MNTLTINNANTESENESYFIMTADTIRGRKYQISVVTRVVDSYVDFNTMMRELPQRCKIKFFKSKFTDEQWNTILNQRENTNG